MTCVTEIAASPSAPHASWIGIGSLAVGAFALVTGEFLPVGLLPEISREIGVTHGQTGLMVTMPGVLGAIALTGSLAISKQATSSSSPSETGSARQGTSVPFANAEPGKGRGGEGNATLQDGTLSTRPRQRS